MAGDDRRTRILDAAEELFAEDGFDATPTARIADAAAVPKGLVFYYFPRKIDLLLTLLHERLPAPSRDAVEGVVSRGDPARSLLALHRRLGLDTHDSLVLRTIIFRESGTHPEVRAHLRRLRRSAAETFVSVMLDHANARRAGGALPDMKGAAAVVALAVGTRPLFA
jgi:AcrR family transcriptional regulator